MFLKEQDTRSELNYLGVRHAPLQNTQQYERRRAPNFLAIEVDCVNLIDLDQNERYLGT